MSNSINVPCAHVLPSSPFQKLRWVTMTTLTTTTTADQCLSPANHTLAEGQKSDSPKVIYIYICYDLTSLSAKYMTITTTEVNIVGIFSYFDRVRIGYN